MKKLPRLCLAGLLLVAPFSLFAAAFEGKVTMKMSSSQDKGEPTVMNLSLKEGFYRMDMSAPEKKGESTAMATIMDLGKLEMYILMPEQKMYMLHKLTPPQGSKDKVETSSDVTVERTGKTENILGYKAEQYLVKTQDGSTEIWATDQLGTYMGTSAGKSGGGGGIMGRRSSNRSAAQAWEKAFTGKDFFPLRVTTLDKKAKESFRMEATAIEKQTLDSSLFAPPADYQKFGMGSMLKGALPGFGK